MGGLLSRCLLVQANDTLRFDRRNTKPRPTKPISIITHVAGSGTMLPVNENEALNGPWWVMSVPMRDQSGASAPAP